MVYRAYGPKATTFLVIGCLLLVFVAVAIGMWPVSYTHLRAHETVLDLVCRLLLEKKND